MFMLDKRTKLASVGIRTGSDINLAVTMHVPSNVYTKSKRTQNPHLLNLWMSVRQGANYKQLQRF